MFHKFRGKVDSMGPLERRVMRTIWTNGEMNVRAVCEALSGELAYTTVMTTVDRLHQKGLLNRRLEGKAYFYTPAVSEAGYESAMARSTIEQLLERNPRPSENLLSNFVDAVTERDKELLDELSRLIKEKKRKLKREDL